jgi:hypothetical protein
MQVGIDKTGQHRFSSAIDDGSTFMPEIFPIFSISEGNEFTILDSKPGSMRKMRL